MTTYQFENPELYRATDNTVFKVIARYTPQEDNDTWIEYEHTGTNARYTCRLEAFEARFSPTN